MVPGGGDCIHSACTLMAMHFTESFWDNFNCLCKVHVDETYAQSVLLVSALLVFAGGTYALQSTVCLCCFGVELSEYPFISEVCRKTMQSLWSRTEKMPGDSSNIDRIRHLWDVLDLNGAVVSPVGFIWLDHFKLIAWNRWQLPCYDHNFETYLSISDLSHATENHE